MFLQDWSECAPLLMPRTGHGICVVDGAVYAVGGVSGAETVGSVERYDAASNSWSFIDAMPGGGRSGAAVCSVGSASALVTP
jgi:hypothetical protein